MENWRRMFMFIFIITATRRCDSSGIVFITDVDQFARTEQMIQHTQKRLGAYNYTVVLTTPENKYGNFKLLSAESENDWSAVVDVTGDHCPYRELWNTLYISAASFPCQGSDTLHIRPSVSTYVKAAVSFKASENRIDSVAVFTWMPAFDNLINASSLMVDKTHVQVLLLQINNTWEIGAEIVRIRTETTIRDVVVIGNTEQVELFATQIASTDSLGRGVRWIMINLDGETPRCLSCTKGEIVYMRPIINDITVLEGFPDELQTMESSYLYDAILRAGFLNIPCNMTSGNGCGEEKPHYDVGHEVNGVMGPIIRNTSNTYLALRASRIIFRGNITEEIEVGNWSTVGGQKWMADPYLPNRGDFLRVVTMHEPPFVFRTEVAGEVRYTGYTIDVLNEMAKRLSFTYILFEPVDKFYGNLRDDGTWTGIMGEMVRGAADMAAAPLSVTAEREGVVDFTTPYYDFAGTQILMKKIESRPGMFAFSTVFRSDVWLCWGSVLTVTGLFIALFDRLSPYSYRNKPEAYSSGRIFSIAESMWFVIGSFTLFGIDYSPRASSTRILVAGFWFFCSIMMATYTANLAAFLTISRLNVPIKSLDDLAAQSTIKYSTIRDSAIQTYFKRMADIENNFYSLWKEMSYGKNGGVQGNFILPNKYAVWDYPLGDKYMQIWTSMEATGFLKNSKIAVDRVANENFAFLQESPMIKYLMSQRCDLVAIGSQFSSKPYAFALTEKSPLVKEISTTILLMQQDRILENLKQKWWQNSTVTCAGAGAGSGLTFDTVGGIFVVMAGGATLGLAIMAIENLIDIFSSFKQEARSDVDSIINKEHRSNVFSVSVPDEQEDTEMTPQFLNVASTIK